MKNDEVRTRRCGSQIRFIQIVVTQPKRATTIREMFEQLARDEEAMMREARKRVLRAFSKMPPEGNPEAGNVEEGVVDAE